MVARPTARVASAGFTLVELLVALTLLAFISMMFVGSLRFAHMAWAKGDAATERLQRLEMAMSVLRREVQDAYALPVPGTPPSQIVTFTGNEDSLVFLAPPAAALAMGGVQLTWLTIERQGGEARVVLRWRYFDRDHESWLPALDGADMTRLVLADHLAGAALSYFGPDAQPNSVAQWHRDWSDALSLPSLVRLAFVGGSQALPDIVIAPRLGGAAGIVPPAALRVRN